MKHAIALLAVGMVFRTLAFAQGLLVFANYGGGVNSPLYEQDGVTPVTGPAYVAGLWLSVETNVTNSDRMNYTGITEPFRTGLGAGYFLGGYQAVPGTVPGQVVSVQVRAWRIADGLDFSAAQAAPGGRWGIGNIFPVTLVSGTGSEGYFWGMRSFKLTVNAIPEPSVSALAVLGGSVLVFCRGGRRFK